MKIKFVIFFISLFCVNVFVISGISSNKTVKIYENNGVPENVVYAHVFYLVVNFDKNDENKITESDRNYFQNYFKKEALLSDNQHQILVNTANNFISKFSSTSGKRRFDISLDYKNELKQAFGSDEFRRFDNFVKTQIAQSIKYFETENFGFSGSSGISLDEPNHILRGSSTTIVFFFSPNQATGCSVNATMKWTECVGFRL